MRSINQYLDELEQDPRILSASWHVGYIRHDTDVAGRGIVVVPATEADQAYAEGIADKLADYVWNKRHEFHYTGTTAKPQEALDMALSFEGKPFVITDSGDNTTSGATGWNTYILRQALAAKSDKRILFASICDPKTCDLLDGLKIGTKTSIELGVGHDAMSEKVSLEVTVLSKGRSSGRSASAMRICAKTFGKCVVVHVENTAIDIIVANHRQSYAHAIQFESAGVNWMDYDVTVETGLYLPVSEENAAGYVMSLTDGATPQDTASIPFKRIMRPMFPVDKI